MREEEPTIEELMELNDKNPIVYKGVVYPKGSLRILEAKDE